MNKDLKSRIPAAILYVLGIAIMTLNGVTTSIILLLVFLGLCLFEFINTQTSNVVLSIINFAISMLFVSLMMLDNVRSQVIVPMAILSAILLVANIIHLIVKKKNFIFSFPSLISTVIYIGLPFIISVGMLYENESFPKILFGVFIILWLNDAGAYFSGRAFGKNKLFPTISPNKTWEGLLGGGIIGSLLSVFLVSILNVLDIQSWLAISVIVWIAGSYGDLVESSWKRSLGIKDSGHLMGGHGGFLARLDSFLFAIPFVSLYLLLLK